MCVYIYTLCIFNIAMENGPFIDGLPIKHGDFPWLCYNHRVHVYRHVPMLCATRLRRTRLPGAQPLHVHV